MALTDRNILISPSRGASNEPLISFTGGTALTSATNYLRVLDDGTISFEGSAGQLWSVQNTLSGTIYSINDRSGIPSLTVDADGAVRIAKYQGIVYIGNNTPSTNTQTGALQVLGGIGVSGNLNIGGSFAMNANLGVGGAGSTYGITVSTTTNVAGYFYNSGDSEGIAIQVGASANPLGIGFNSYNNVGTTYVMGTGHHAQAQLSAGSLNFLISSASQSAGSIATQIQGLGISASGITVPVSTAAPTNGTTGTGAIITYGGISAGGNIAAGGDLWAAGVRVGRGSAAIATNTVIGNAAGAGLLTGGGNLLIGYQAGTALTSAANNTAIGYQALLAQTATGGNNVAIGYQALYTANNASMTNNTAIGYRALGLGNGAFYGNTAVGYQGLANVSSGYYNTAIGYNAGNQLSTGAQNVTIGYNSGNALGGQNNVVIIGGASGSTVENGRIILSDGAGNIRIDFNGTSGDARIYSTTAASTTAGTGALRVDGGLSVASGMNLAGALYAANSAGTSGQFLKSTGTGIAWDNAAQTVVDDTTTNATRYIQFTNSVSGTITTTYVSSSKLTYNPSTGIITGAFSGPHNGTVGATTAASGNFTTLACTQFTATNGGTTHAITGPASNALTVSNGVGNGSGVCLNVAGSGDIQVTGGGSLMFGNYNYAGSTYIRGYTNGEMYIYRAGANLFQTVAGGMQVNGTLYVTGDVYTNYSDIRLKDVKGPITNALDKVMQLEGFYYTANEIAQGYGFTTETKVGLSAQAVLKVQPEAVTPAAFDVTEDRKGSKSGENYLGVDYERLVPLLVEAIKEQQAQIEGLKAELKALKQ